MICITFPSKSLGMSREMGAAGVANVKLVESVLPAWEEPLAEPPQAPAVKAIAVAPAPSITGRRIFVGHLIWLTSHVAENRPVTRAEHRRPSGLNQYQPLQEPHVSTNVANSRLGVVHRSKLCSVKLGSPAP